MAKPEKSKSSHIELWNFMKTVWEFSEKIKNSNNLRCFSEYIGKNYGTYRCYPIKDCNVKCLNFGKEPYNPIIFIAITNNLSIKEGKEYGINISIELAECKNNAEENRKKLYEIINNELKTNYSTLNWKTIQQEQIISREDYFHRITEDENANESIINDNEVNEKIDKIIKYILYMLFILCFI